VRSTVAANPLIHRDPARDAGVDRSGRSVLGHMQDGRYRSPSRLAQTRSLLAEQQHASQRQVSIDNAHRTWEQIDSEQGQLLPRRPRGEVSQRFVMSDIDVAIRHHRAPTVPPAIADDVHGGSLERVRVSHYRADVHVVLPVLDGDMERPTMRFEIRHDRVVAPVAVAVDDVAPIARRQQCRIEAGVRRPWLRMRPYADLRTGC
jgi:hypothetical protein